MGYRERSWGRKGTVWGRRLVFCTAPTVSAVVAATALAGAGSSLGKPKPIVVPNTKPISVLSEIVLDPAHRYRIVARGRVSDWPNAPEDGYGVDALYCYAEWRCPGHYLWRQLRVKRAEAEWGPDWGQGLDEFGGEADELTYNPAHVYAVEVQGVAGRLEFATWDAFVLKSHAGNKGAFTVEITDLGGEAICRDPRYDFAARTATIVADPFERGPIRGTPRNDVIVGTSGPDTIFGGGGNDLICGRGGADTIDGGAGGDVILGEGGGDTLIGGSGNDHLFGGENADTLRGGLGADHLYGDDGADVLLGGAGVDSLYGGGGNDKLQGEAGLDHLEGGPGNDLLDGGEGRDTAAFGWDDFLAAKVAERPVAVSLRAGTATGAGNDTLRSVEWIRGTRNDDVLRGSDGPDLLDGGSGNDRIYGLGGADRLSGGYGDDLLVGGPGLDTASGGAGTDTCSAERRRGCEILGIAAER